MGFPFNDRMRMSLADPSTENLAEETLILGVEMVNEGAACDCVGSKSQMKVEPKD